jgi:gas vesicle structural protein
MAVARQQNRYVGGPSPSGLADVLDLILDKGLVIDVYVRVSLVGIELLTIDARIVVASVDTYLRFAEAVGRLDLQESSDSKNLPELVDDVTTGASKTKTKGALEGAKEKVTEVFGSDDDEEDEEEVEEPVDEAEEEPVDEAGEDDDRERVRKRVEKPRPRRRRKAASS